MVSNSESLRSIFYVYFAIVVVQLTISAQINAQTTVRFAAVGDYGDNSNTQAVADLIDSWNPDFVITLGDNNYSNNSTVSAWDDEVGQYYGQFIHYPAGSTSFYAPGSSINEFFPALGNHDWDAGINGWYDYFELPGNERYYEFIQGPVHFFVIDSDSREPDGITETSMQGQWLQAQLASSTSPWKIVYFHHPPYSSSSNHGNTPELQWPFQSWGATAVLAGHDHLYERILKNGFPYFVNGAGGRSLYNFNSTPEPGSMVRYNSNYGAMLIEANTDNITFQFYSISGGSGGTLIDTYTMNEPPPVLNTVVFQEGFDGYSSTVDAHIRQEAPSSSHGSLGSVEWDSQESGLNSQKFALIRFDNIIGSGVGQIPQGATIINATLEYEVWNTGDPADVNEISVQWSEGVTYNTFGSEAGVQSDDYGASLGAASGSTTGSHSIDVTTSLTAWSANPSLNNGWIFRPTGTDGVDLRSSEYGTTDQRPKLTIEYSTSNEVPNQPSLISPTDMAVDVITSPTLTVTVSDPDVDDLTVTFFGRVKSGAAFTLIGLPDTQFYSSSLNGGSPAIFNAQTQWIVANKDALNIVYVPHLGDCVQNGDNNGNPIEWENADVAISYLEDSLTTSLPDGIPYGIAVGNHDQSPIGSPDGTTTFYNQYFGESRFLGRSYYGGHYGSNNDNSYEFFSAGGIDFIVIYFEFDPTPDTDVLNWADNLLQTHSDRRGIIVSHYLIEIGNPGGFGTQGQAIYDALKSNSNLFLMLCGHISGEGRRTDIFEGNTVHTILSDYQSRTNGGDGWLRIMNFSTANNEISVQTYSPTLDQFEIDDDSQFTLNYDFQGNDFEIIGINSGVASGSNSSKVWPTLALLTEYEWYVEINDGSTTIAGPVWSFTTVEDDDPLPVNLSLFTSEAGDEMVTLNWITQSEINNLGFILERALSSGGPFLEISSYEYRVELKGQGNSSFPTEYSYTDGNLENGTTYFYRLADVNFNGVKTYHPLISAMPQQPAMKFLLHTNYPNPFNQGTTIIFEIPNIADRKSHIDLVIYNSLGEIVRRLVKEPIAGGVHKILWQGDNDEGELVSSGVYFLRLKMDSFVQTQKMVLLR